MLSKERGLAMTDGTLRVECEKLLAELLIDSPVDRTQRILAFARAQQAKGLQIAAGLCELEAIVDDERGYYGKAMGKMIREHIEKLA